MYALPDIDGDGSHELAWTSSPDGDRLHVSYGGSDLDPARLAEPQFTLAAENMRPPATTVTDIDGDGAMDLLVLAGGMGGAPFGLYVIPAEALRGAREATLEHGRLWLVLSREQNPSARPMGLGLDAGGDVNGDGLDDVLITSVELGPDTIGGTEVRLLPGGTPEG